MSTTTSTVTSTVTSTATSTARSAAVSATDRRRLAELDHVRSLLTDASEIVRTGWLQHGRQHGDRACLVGAIMQAGQGTATVDPFAVARSIDLAWHTLNGDDGRQLRRRPAPLERAARVGELARWNDGPDRRPEHVAELLRTAAEAAATERHRLQTAS